MNWLKISSFSGMLAPFIAFTLILLSTAYSEDFSWTGNALSDLGVQTGVTAVLFNAGLIVTGILTFFFASGLFIFLQENRLGRVGAFILILDAVALTAIGVFPENIKPTHYIASLIFFTLFPISMFLLSISFVGAAKPKLGLFTFLVAVVAAVVWVVPYSRGVAIPESLSALSASTWSIVLSFKMLKEASRSKN
jgi:hypothetical membrane protein